MEVFAEIRMLTGILHVHLSVYFIILSPKYDTMTPFGTRQMWCQLLKSPRLRLIFHQSLDD